MRTFFSAVWREYLKWLQSLKTALSKSLHYKINLFILMIAPSAIFFIIKYNLWTSIYSVHSSESIQGYSLSRMIEYQFWILILDLFVRSVFFSQSLSQDIRLGRISAFLLYPFNYISYQSSLFAADKLLQLFIGGLSLFLAVVFGWIALPPAGVLLKAGIFILMVSAFWLFIQLAVGFMAFWLEETWSINVSVRFISAFLSGSIIPLDLYPKIMAEFLMWTPFPYLAYAPVKILMREPVEFGFSLLILFVWLLALLFFVQRIWKRGLRLYSGAGI